MALPWIGGEHEWGGGEHEWGGMESMNGVGRGGVS